MRLFLDTTLETDWAQSRWESISALWPARAGIALVGKPSEADAILVTLADCRASYPQAIAAVAGSEACRRWPDKTFVFDTQDTPLGLFPGLYCSLRRLLYSPTRHRTGCYMQSFNEFVGQSVGTTPAGATGEFRYLFSFQGNLTSRTRGRLFATAWNRDDVLVERTQPIWTDTAGHTELKKHYADILDASRFVLCPRGIGTSTFRLFETLQSGRVPVILSDDWVAPAGIDWDAISLRVREADIGRLAEICEANLQRWPGMAGQARQTWERWFSPAGMGELVRTSLEDILRRRRLPERTYRLGWPLRRSYSAARGALARGVSKLRRGG